MITLVVVGWIYNIVGANSNRKYIYIYGYIYRASKVDLLGGTKPILDSKDILSYIEIIKNEAN